MSYKDKMREHQNVQRHVVDDGTLDVREAEPVSNEEARSMAMDGFNKAEKGSFEEHVYKKVLQHQDEQSNR